MSEFMRTAEFPEVDIKVEFEPVKGTEFIEPALLEAHAEVEIGALRDVDHRTVRSTCMDERERSHKRNGSTEIEPRLSVPGGSDIYGLAVSELTDSMPENVATGDEALASVKRRNNAAGIASGGHVDCKAAAAFTDWMRMIADSPDAVRPYVQKMLGEAYDESIFRKVSENAAKALSSGRYPEGWNGEEALIRVLGDEAGEAIEVLVPGPHKAKKVVRQLSRGKTVHQNVLVQTSVIGEGSFVIDDPHAADIESVQTSGADAAAKMHVARYAREAIIGALAGAVPNETLYQDTLAPSA